MALSKSSPNRGLGPEFRPHGTVPLPLPLVLPVTSPGLRVATPANKRPSERAPLVALTKPAASNALRLLAVLDPSNSYAAPLTPRPSQRVRPVVGLKVSKEWKPIVSLRTRRPHHVSVPRRRQSRRPRLPFCPRRTKIRRRAGRNLFKAGPRRPYDFVPLFVLGPLSQTARRTPTGLAVGLA